MSPAAPVAPAVVAGIVFFAALNALLEEVFWRGLLARLPASDAVRILYPAAMFAFAHWFNLATYLPLLPAMMAVMGALHLHLGRPLDVVLPARAEPARGDRLALRDRPSRCSRSR